MMCVGCGRVRSGGAKSFFFVFLKYHSFGFMLVTAFCLWLMGYDYWWVAPGGQFSLCNTALN